MQIIIRFMITELLMCNRIFTVACIVKFLCYVIMLAHLICLNISPISCFPKERVIWETVVWELTQMSVGVPQLGTRWQVSVGPGTYSRGSERHHHHLHLHQQSPDWHCWVQQAQAACPEGNDAVAAAEFEPGVSRLCWFGAGWRCGGAEAGDSGEGAGDGCCWSPGAAGSHPLDPPTGARVCLSGIAGFGSDSVDSARWRWAPSDRAPPAEGSPGGLTSRATLLLKKPSKNVTQAGCLGVSRLPLMYGLIFKWLNWEREKERQKERETPSSASTSVSRARMKGCAECCWCEDVQTQDWRGRGRIREWRKGARNEAQ